MNARPVVARSVTSENQNYSNANEVTCYSACLRVLVLSFSLSEGGSEEVRHAATAGDILGFANGSNKFPKDATKALKEHLQLAWMGKDPNINDPAIKASLANFYNIYAEDHFYRQVRENRKVEELILIFVSCATKELQKRSLQAPIDQSQVNTQTAAFIQLVVETLEEFVAHTNVRDIIAQLRSWIVKLNQSQTSTLSSSLDQKGFYVNDMPLVKALGALFAKSPRQLQEDVTSIKLSQLNLEASAYLRTRLQRAKDNDLNLHKYASEESKSTEIVHISSLLKCLPVSPKLHPPNLSQAVKTVAPSNDKIIQDSITISAQESRIASKQTLAVNKSSALRGLDLSAPTATMNELKSDYSFIPPVVQNAIAELLRLSILQTDGAPPSKEQRALILDFRFWWNVSDAEYYSIVMKMLCDLYESKRLGTKGVKQYLCDITMDIKTISPRDREILAVHLSKVFKLTRQLLFESLKIIFKVHNRVIFDLVELFEFLRSHPLFDETVNIPTRQFEETVCKSARKLYISWNDDFPANVEPVHISNIITKMLKVFAKTRQKYQSPIFSNLSVPALLIESQMSLFSNDLDRMMIFMKENSASENDKNDIFTIYGQIVELNKACCESAPKKQVDVSAYFTAYLSEWLQRTDEKISDWVQNAISQDTFVSTDENNKHSTSVVDSFTSMRHAFEFLKNLEWNNEYENARFMTMLSRTFCSAITCYCGALNVGFSKICNLSDALSVDVHSTEKWLAIAKLAIGKREKLEAFVFPADCCVKLDNIEYARKELDLLEKDMETDAIARTLKNHGYNGISKQGVQRYTIKIVEAEDVISTQSSAPKTYATMNDDEGRRLHRTRTVYAGSNPRWDETFDVSTTNSLSLRCRVWNESRNNENHNLAGGCGLKVDVSLYKDLVPRQFWVELDTGGRVLLRIHMEGERDDIHFYFGRAFQTLTRTEREMIRLIVDKLAPYIREFISTSTLRNLVGGNMIQSVSRLLNSTGISKVQSSKRSLTDLDIEDSIQVLLNLFNDTFVTLNDNLTRSSLVKVMIKVWKEVLISIEACVLPSLLDKPSTKVPLSEKEFDVVYKWLRILYDFFNAEGDGVPRDVLQSTKYSEICSIAMFYFESTESLIKSCEDVALLSLRNEEKCTTPTGGMLLYRQKTVMHHQNLGTIKQRKQSKFKTPLQPTDDLLLRILRMRPNTEKVGYKLTNIDF